MILTDAVLFVFFFVSFRGTRVLIPLETCLRRRRSKLKIEKTVVPPWSTEMKIFIFKFFSFANDFLKPTHMHSRFTVPFTAKVNYGVSQGHLPPPPRPPLQFCPEWEVSVNVDLREGWVISYPKTSIDPFSVCGFKWKLPFSTFRWYFFVLYMVVLTFQSVSKTPLCDHSNESY